jgi:hypothetical protein
MALNENSFFQYKETRAQSGYKSAWLYYDTTISKYRLLCLSETVPYVFGADNDSFEFDILQSETKGLVQGKANVETKSVEVLHHRDNAYRFNKLKGKTIDFMTINGDLMGYKYSGTLDYRPNDAESDVNRATVTITPMSADATPVFNARSLIAETLCFAQAIDATIKAGQTFDLSVKQSTASVTYSLVKINDDGTETEDKTSLNSSNPKQASISKEGLYAITVADASTSDPTYASWTTTVYVEPSTTV